LRLGEDLDYPFFWYARRGRVNPSRLLKRNSNRGSSRDDDKFVAIDSDEETVALRTSEPMKLSIYGNNIGKPGQVISWSGTSSGSAVVDENGSVYKDDA
jgi:hypothetical protein